MQTIQLSNRHIYDGHMVLVNKQHPIQIEPSRELMPASDCRTDILMAKLPATLLTQLIKDCKADNKIVPVSGYRSLHEQQELFTNSLRDNGRDFTLQYVALPNCSEHQTGLAIDVAEQKENIDFLCPHFPYTGICGQFRAKAADYGFIERYSKGKEEITGIAHEPWHFRYVGYPHSKIMEGMSLTLEEYVDHLRQYLYPKKALSFREKGKAIKISFIPLQEDKPVSLKIRDGLSQISGNNVDGAILTVW